MYQLTSTELNAIFEQNLVAMLQWFLPNKQLTNFCIFFSFILFVEHFYKTLFNRFLMHKILYKKFSYLFNFNRSSSPF